MIGSIGPKREGSKRKHNLSYMLESATKADSPKYLPSVLSSLGSKSKYDSCRL